MRWLVLILLLCLPFQASAITVEILVVGGAGSGGTRDGGGGGAGGYTLKTVTANVGTTYNVTVGGGGIPCIGIGCATQNPTSGSDSTFDTTTSTGGGRGASGGTFEQCATGGSGGGWDANPGSGCAGTAGQGNAGGSGVSSFFTGAGGGGASAVGANGGGANGNPGGAGGNGLASTITGASVTYAGGGGGGAAGTGTGGTAGTGGGGAGGASGINGTNGTDGKGGGGGAAGGSADTGGQGGAGIIIVDASTTAVTGDTVNCGSGALSTITNETLCTYTGSGTSNISTTYAITVNVVPSSYKNDYNWWMLFNMITPTAYADDGHVHPSLMQQFVYNVELFLSHLLPKPKRFGGTGGFFAHVTGGVVDNLLVDPNNVIPTGAVGNPTTWIATAVPEGTGTLYNPLAQSFSLSASQVESVFISSTSSPTI